MVELEDLQPTQIVEWTVGALAAETDDGFELFLVLMAPSIEGPCRYGLDPLAVPAPAERVPMMEFLLAVMWILVIIRLRQAYRAWRSRRAERRARRRRYQAWQRSLQPVSPYMKCTCDVICHDEPTAPEGFYITWRTSQEEITKGSTLVLRARSEYRSVGMLSIVVAWKVVS